MFAVGACRLRNTLPENDTDRINIDVFTNLFIRLVIILLTCFTLYPFACWRFYVLFQYFTHL